MRKSDHNYGAARIFRKNMTLPETLLWRELKGRKAGPKFRRQHPIGPYILDFYCAAAKAGFEIDGLIHDMGDNPARGGRRDAWLAERGITVMRIPASEVLTDPVATAEETAIIAKERS